MAFRWSGQVLEPNDYMGFIGRNPGDENVYIATGDSGQGMTHGTIAGMLIPDLILGIENRWAEAVRPGARHASLRRPIPARERERRSAVRGLGNARRGVVT